MDNLTHSLMGVVLGRALTKKSARSKSDMAWRSCAVVTGIVASNLPDADFLFFLHRSNEKLNYLVHHRGFTHTVLISIVLSVLLGFAIGKIYKLNKKRMLQNLLLSIGAGLLHIFADSWNDYGVHPFWPISNRWFYGDTIFIVEPLLIFSMLPLAYFTAEKWGKRIWAAAGAGILILSWASPFSQWTTAVWISLVAAGFYFWQKSEPSRLRPALTGIVGTLVLFFISGQIARSDARAILLKGDRKGAEIRQLMTSPAPSNPFCWRIIAATVDPEGGYVAHLGFVSLAPKIIEPFSCFSRWIGQQSAPLHPPLLPSNSKVFWYADFQARAKEFVRLENQNCTANGVSRFLRIPFWVENEDQYTIGDLRYDREKRRGFAEFEISKKTTECLVEVPPWDRPIDLN